MPRIAFDIGNRTFYDAPFMSRQLPELIDPVQLADKGQEIIGQVAISRMSRIQDSLMTNSGCFDVVLRFGKDGAGQRFIKGTLHGTLQLCCQRCMLALAWPVDAGFSLALLYSEAQIETLADHYEPFLLPDEKVKLIELLEDEVILQLPLVPRHEVRDCPAAADVLQFGEQDAPKSAPDDTPEAEGKPNPFSVLATMKTGKPGPGSGPKKPGKKTRKR